ncbi:MAG TPA: STAS domain-containing protein [Candidatus Dormibacteraeota bacterium]|nr:STAS domain-containing protein [Candidatus Dormibacteraeota bacterium]
MIDVEGARAPLEAVPVDARPDRCPYSRSFTAEFVENPCCPAFQATTFTVADLRHRPLNTTLTCQHLTVGNGQQNGGRFYPRCGLGSADDRLRWLAGFGSARLDVVRSLEEEFEAEMAERRDQLVEARERLLPAAAGDSTAPADFELRLTEFVDGAAAFIAARAVRFADVGLPADQLSELLADWASTWARSRDGHGPAISDLPLSIFARESPTFVPGGNAIQPGPPADDAGSAGLVLEHTADPCGLRLGGNIDVSNSMVLAAALSAALSAAAASLAEVTVDFRGVLFCDVSGLRALVQAAAHIDGGRRIRVVGLPDHLLRATRLAEWAALPGLVFEP